MFTWLRRRLHQNRDRMMRAFYGYSIYTMGSLRRDLRISHGTILRYLTEFENQGWITSVDAYQGQFQSTKKGREHFRQTLSRTGCF